MPATTLAAVRRPVLATSTIPDHRTTSSLVVEEAEAFRGVASGAEVGSTAVECVVASTPAMETRT